MIETPHYTGTTGHLTAEGQYLSIDTATGQYVLSDHPQEPPTATTAAPAEEPGTNPINHIPEPPRATASGPQRKNRFNDYWNFGGINKQ